MSLADMLDNGTSTITLAATLEVIDSFIDKMLSVLWQSVDSMDIGADKKNPEAVVNHFESRGIYTLRVVTTCSDYYLPQRRVRMFFPGHNTEHACLADSDPSEFHAIVIEVMEVRDRV